ncbi:MAG TPA: oxygenase MpaB family protein, partial [Candidatus Acidoferrales bacterium]|nr:oxygenase MpaB family protein [Candidatus Acidoferrales bacterium]
MGDDAGLFGPGSTAWRLHAHPGLLVGGVRALMLQALHPLAIAAVEQHSQYREDVWGRFQRTSDYVVTTVFGDRAAAQEAGRRVRAVHRRIRGVDPVTGLAYSAEDPELLLWIHMVLVDSFVVAYRRFAGRLPKSAADAYVGEMVRQAELVGLRLADVPATYREMVERLRGYRSQLRITEPARDGLQLLFHPPESPLRPPAWRLVVAGAITLLPHWARGMYGLKGYGPLEPAVALSIRAGSWWTRRYRQPPPVLREARVRAEAAGLP